MMEMLLRIQSLQTRTISRAARRKGHEGCPSLRPAGGQWTMLEIPGFPLQPKVGECPRYKCPEKFSFPYKSMAAAMLGYRYVVLVE